MRKASPGIFFLFLMFSIFVAVLFAIRI